MRKYYTGEIKRGKFDCLRLQKLHLLLFLIFIVPGHQLSYAQTDTLRVLFVGNSYTYTKNLPQIVSILSTTTDIYLKTQQSTIAGGKLWQHWHGKRGLNTREIIDMGNFDRIIFQDHSMAAIAEPDSLYLYGTLFAQLASRMGAKPIFYQTWAKDSVPESISVIRDQYALLTNSTDAKVARVGEAWQLAKQLNPNIQLYTEDGSHPDKLGVFLTALVMTQLLTEKIPDLPHNEFSTLDKHQEFIQLMHISDVEYAFLRSVVERLLQK